MLWDQHRERWAIGGTTIRRITYCKFRELTAGMTDEDMARIGRLNAKRMSGAQLSAEETDTLAVVTMRFERDLKIPDDTIASVKTAGLIGDKFIAVTPGGSPDILPRGGEISDTEPAVDLGSLISKYAFGDVKK